MVAPPISAKSDSTEATVDATVSGKLVTLPGGDLQLAVGGQFRREELNNRSINPNLDLPGVSTAQAFGKRTVWAGYFEIDAPVLDMLDISLSGRYDHYSTGIGRFSPKVGVKFEPIKGVALRGTYSEGFRAPTFAESDARSSFSGFVGYTPNAAFIAAHPGNAGYTATYSLGRGFVGNPNIKPEISRSFTAGAIIDPVRVADLHGRLFPREEVEPDRHRSAGGRRDQRLLFGRRPDLRLGRRRVGRRLRQGRCDRSGLFVQRDRRRRSVRAQLAAALLVLNAPYVNSAYLVVSGLEFSLDARIPI